MKKALTFLLTLILNASFAQDALPFKKRFYLELNGGAGIYSNEYKSYKNTNSPSSYYYYQYGYLYGYTNTFTYKYQKAHYITGSVGGFYKHGWIKAGIFYQGGYPKTEQFQHSINAGVGFNTFGWLKKSILWMGPFASTGGIIPFDGKSYIGSYRLDLGADLYIYNFHLGYRHSWWNNARSSDVRNMKIHYMEIGYAIPLRNRESRKIRSSYNTPQKKEHYTTKKRLYSW